MRDGDPRFRNVLNDKRLVARVRSKRAKVDSGILEEWKKDFSYFCEEKSWKNESSKKNKVTRNTF
jgi:hypothetical protein